VLNPGKTDLTGPAKTILTNPTFLPDSEAGAAALGGAAEAGGAMSVFSASTLFPSVAAFGLGAVIGSEICKVAGISGCWQITGTTPSETATGYTWMQLSEPSEYPNQWWWSRGPALYEGKEGYCAGTGSVYPARADHYKVISTVSTECRVNGEGEWKKVTASTIQPLRWYMKDRSIGYSATDTAMPNYEPGGKPYEANSKWSEKMASALKEKSDSTEAGRLGKHIASKIEGSKVSDPYPHKVTVPSCSGEAWIECKADLEELELVPERSELNWSEARLDLKPNEVVELNPEPGTEITLPSETKTVIVTTNPDESGMPVVIPQPEPGETYDHYVARLNPLLSPERHDLESAYVVAADGPNAVEQVEPAPDTRLDPAGPETTVRVTVNPADVPAVAGWVPPSVGSIDTSPLEGVTPCNVFPFGAACWFVEALQELGGGGACPKWSLEFLGAVPGMSGEGQELELCEIQPVVDGVRPWIYFVGTIFMFVAFAAWARGGGTPSDDPNAGMDAAD